MVVHDKLHLNGITRLANGDLLVVGENGLAAVSTDGLHWQRLQVPYEGSFFGALPWGAQGAIAYGVRGNVYAAEDVHAGTWHQIQVTTTSSFFGGLKLSDDNSVVVGGDGAVFKIDHSGTAHLVSNNSGHSGQSAVSPQAFLQGGLLLVARLELCTCRCNSLLTLVVVIMTKQNPVMNSGVPAAKRPRLLQMRCISRPPSHGAHYCCLSLHWHYGFQRYWLQ